MEINNKISSDILTSFIKISEDLFLTNISTFNLIVDDFIPIRQFEKENIKSQSIYFNVFDFFKINEPLHSKLIASLLDPGGNHGQGNLFLLTFFDFLKIEYHDKDVWQVTAEIGRIDILIKCLNRRSVIIIENKSNGANCQPNQLYRYWYQEIYLQFEYNGQITNCLSKNKNFRIIYLAPEIGKNFENHSIERPNELKNQIGLPESLKKDEIEHLTFSNFIVPWLKECLLLNDVHADNQRIREFIKQYIILWEMNY